MTTNKDREEWHKPEVDLFTKPCEHTNIEEDSIIHPSIGVEYYDRCADCGEDTISFK